ncbi:MAG: STAS domain-containing protein, partial [Tardiphaga sp.]
MAPLLEARSTANALELSPSGSWTAAHVIAMESLFDAVAPRLQQATALKVDMAGVRELDTLGAWLIEKMTRRASAVGRAVEIIGVAGN